MLELGRSGAAGAARREHPVLHDGAVVARLRPAAWREAATATVGNCDWVFRSSGLGLVGRRAEAAADERGLWVEPTSVWRHSWRGKLQGTRVELHPVSTWQCTYRVVVAGADVGTGGSTGGWRPRPTLTVDDGVPLDQQVFLLWVLLLAGWQFHRIGPAPWVAGLAAAVIGGR